MTCNCKTEMTAALKERLAAKHPDSTITSVELMGYSVGITNDRVAVVRPSTTVEVVRQVPTKAGGTRTKKERVTLFFSYCPHCGKKVA